MKRFVSSMAAACAAGALGLAAVAHAGDPAAAAPKGEGSAAELEVTLKADDGREVRFVASEIVRNLPQVKVEEAPDK